MAIHHLLDKSKYLPENEVEARLQTCKGGNGKPKCEHLAALTDQCKLCYCFVNLKAKLKTETCPAQKWPSVERS